MEPKTQLLVALGVVGGAFVLFWIVRMARAWGTKGEQASELQPGPPNPIQLAIGFVTNFFDTLGVGSFAPTTSLFKVFKQCPDRVIPGTLNVGHTLPTILEAYIYTQLINVDMTTLVSMIAAAVAGSWIGSGIVAGLPKRKVQIGMGLALAIAVIILIFREPTQDEGAIALTGAKLWIGIGANFILGALMTIGVGLYAPCVVLIMLLGMNGKAAFPIMMGSCAFLMPVASIRFIQKGSYSIKSSLGLAIGGLPAVYIAAKYVEGLPFAWVKWLVVAVVSIAAAVMLTSAFMSKSDSNTPTN